MKEELKPCPFCGKANPSLWQSGGYWKIKCVNGCTISISGYYNKEGAIQAWNNRPAEETTVNGARISTLMKEIQDDHFLPIPTGYSE